jgi:fatty-acyl-CoA synthase
LQPPDTSIPLRETTVGLILREAASEFGSRIALVEGTAVGAEERRRWTFADLRRDAEQVAGSLLERFDPGERVAVWAPNIPEWVLLELGAGLAGVVLVTINPAYKTKELEYVLRQSRAAGVFFVPEFRGNPMSAWLDEVRPGLDGLRETISFSSWDEFVASCPPAPRLPEMSPEDPAQIQYTSGTTGFPKGAVLHHRGLTNNARIFAALNGMGPEDVYVSAFPMFHTAGCVCGTLGTLQSGARHVPLYGSDPSAMLNLLESEQATVALAVPTVLIGLLEQAQLKARELSSLRLIMSGGATVPAELVRRIEDSFGVDLVILYGTTECSPQISQVRLDDSFVDKTETLGPPAPQVEVKIAEPSSGDVLPCGTIGELCARGYGVMTGYFDMPEQTAAAIDPDGWYHTGDLASMDDRGYLRIEGRLKDMIIRGGENIYPREIEDLLFEHPKVAEVAVVGVPDATWGEAVAAFVRPAPGETPDEAELFAYCRENLAAFKTPRHWEFVDSFPVTASGKIQKFVLREQFAARNPR